MAIDHIVVHKGTDYHSAFPHVIRLRNGDLLSVFREAPARPGTGVAGEPYDKFTHHHADPDSRIALVRSSDDGRTWDSDTHVVIDVSDGSQDLNMAMVSQLTSGELVVNNHRWSMEQTADQVAAIETDRVIIDREGHPFGPTAFDSIYFIRSGDLGKTWDKPQPVSLSSLAYRTHTGKDGMIEMPDGSHLLPINGYSSSDKSDGVYVIRSRDGGHTWVEPTLVASDPEQRIGFAEPPLLRLPNGRLLCVMRTSGSDGHLYQVFSTDDGWVWQGLKRTPMWGGPCHLLYRRSGRV